ncbi:MAG: hypothetical protein KDA80_08320 [Planctomycetaceae bacterium]|nr:hypothetical protein [Planctomycetaceae bacterium]
MLTSRMKLFSPVVAWGMVLGTLALATPVFGQGRSFQLQDSQSSFIDGAIPGDAMTVRLDNLWNLRHADRGEYYIPKPQSLGGSGLPAPEREVDFRDSLLRVEAMLWGHNTSGFVEVTGRHIEADNNSDTTGWGDLGFGVKRVWIEWPDFILTTQLRSYVPTGDGGRGLGTDHYSLEPGLLWQQKWGECTSTFGEFRYWTPIGGSDFAGSTLRYGFGVQREYGDPACWHWSPVAELIGWTTLDGGTSIPTEAAPVSVRRGIGDMVLNGYIGTRVGLSDLGDLYLGYGHSVTGEKWYSDALRIEFRMFF